MKKTGTGIPGDTFLINTRFLLIVSVFLGNIIEPLIGQFAEVKALYLWIFTFHMPLFVFVTGYFARYSLTGEQGKKTLQLIALQYFIFQSLYSIMDVTVFQVPGIEHSFFMPYLLCWFLMGHIIWRLMLLLFKFLKLQHPVLAATGLAVLIGYGGFDGGFLSITRAFVFLPFFVIGYSFDYAKFQAFLSGYRRVLAGAVSVALFAVLLIYAGDIHPRWLVGAMNYMQMGHSEWYAGLYRLGLYALQLAASVGLLALVPRGESIMTDWGKRTLYVFLLHGFVVRLVVVSGVFNRINHPLEITALLLFAVGATILLAQPFVKKWTHLVIEPDTSWMNRVEKKARGLLGGAR
ncbi:MAG: fucose 4-O-acetylase [Paenibacillaceae bacterium]|nr:fucose 4-O-acetylase [Paenibacillaceae bacterium]